MIRVSPRALLCAGSVPSLCAALCLALFACAVPPPSLHHHHGSAKSSLFTLDSLCRPLRFALLTVRRRRAHSTPSTTEVRTHTRALIHPFHPSASAVPSRRRLKFVIAREDDVCCVTGHRRRRRSRSTPGRADLTPDSQEADQRSSTFDRGGSAGQDSDNGAHEIDDQDSLVSRSNSVGWLTAAAVTVPLRSPSSARQKVKPFRTGGEGGFFLSSAR